MIINQDESFFFGVGDCSDFEPKLSVKKTLIGIHRVCNPGALFQNRDYGAGRLQNRDPGARTGIHSSMKKKNRRKMPRT
jgi:hypothetical protein